MGAGGVFGGQQNFPQHQQKGHFQQQQQHQQPFHQGFKPKGHMGQAQQYQQQQQIPGQHFQGAKQQKFQKKQVPAFLGGTTHQSMEADQSMDQGMHPKQYKGQHAPKSLSQSQKQSAFAKPEPHWKQNQQFKKQSQSMQKEVPSALNQGFGQAVQQIYVQKPKSHSQSLQPQVSETSNQGISSKPQSLSSSYQSQKKQGPKGTKPGQDFQKPINLTNQQEKKKPAPKQAGKAKNTEEEEYVPGQDDYDQEYDDYYDEEYNDEEDYDQEDEGNEEVKQPNSKAYPPAAKKEPLQAKKVEKSGKVCKYFQIGKCQYGEQCKDIHVKSDQKRELCSHFLMGICKYGDNCLNSHDEALRESYLREAQKLMQTHKDPMEIKKLMGQFLQKQQQQQKTSASKIILQQQVMDEELSEEELEQESNYQEMDEIAEKNKKKNLNLLLKQQLAKPKEEEKKGSDALKPQTIKKSLGIKKAPVAMQPQPQIAQSPKIPQIQSSEKPLVIQSQKPSASAPPKSFVPQKTFAIPSQRKADIPKINVDPAILEERRTKILKDLDQMKLNRYQYAIPGKAELVAMISPEEIHQRSEIEVSSANAFEFDRNNQNFNRYAIKAYERSAADKVMDNPQNIRPPEILYKVMEYIRDCIVDLDLVEPGKSIYKHQNPSFLDVYSFVRDRSRTIAQDFIIINQMDNQYYIKSLEEYSRFLICAFHDGFTEPHFDSPQNFQLLTKNLGALKKCYEAIRLTLDPNDPQRNEMLRNEAEFMSYLFISCAGHLDQSANYINGYDISEFDQQGTELLKESIRINHAVANNDYFRFFKLFSSTNYLFACMMLYIINKQRQALLDSIARNPLNIPIELVQKALKMESVQETVSYIEACGFTNVDNNSFNPRERVSREDYAESFKKWKQRERFTFMDTLRGARPRSEIMKNGVEAQDLAKIQEQLQKQREEQQRQRVLQQKLDEQRKQEELKRLEIERKKKQEDEAKRKAEEQKKKELEEQERKLKEIKDKIEREKKEEELRKKRELEEKERQLLLQKKKKEEAQKKLKSLGERLISKKLKQQFLEFSKQYKKLLGKRKARDFTQEFELQLIELFQQDAVIPKPEKQKIIDNIQRYAFDSQKLQDFKITNLLKQVLSNQEGIMRIKLFSQQIGQERRNLNEILSCLLLLFTESEDYDMKVENKQKLYKKKISNKLQYGFRYQEINDKNSPYPLLGTNLILLLTSKHSYTKDIEYFNSEFQNYGPYSRFNMLIFIVDRENQKMDQIEMQIQQSFSDELRDQKIQNLHFSKIHYLTTSRQSRKFKQLQHSQNLKNLLLAYIINDLDISLSQCKLITQKQELKQINLYECIMDAIIDLQPILIDNDPTEVKCQESYFKRFFLDLQQAKEDIYKNQKDNEFQVLNFWLLILKQMIKPVYECLQQSMELLVLRKDMIMNFHDLKRKLQYGLESLDKLMKQQMFDYPLEQDLRYNSKHVNYFIGEKIKHLYESDQQKEIFAKIENILKYQSVPPLSKNRSKTVHCNYLIGYFKGASYFQIIFKPFFDDLDKHSITLIEPARIISYQDIDYTEINNQLKDSIEKNQNTFDMLKTKFPQDFGDKPQPHSFYVKQTEILNKSLLKKRPSKYKEFALLTNEIVKITSNEKEQKQLEEAIQFNQSLEQFEIFQKEQIEKYIEDTLEQDNWKSTMKRRKLEKETEHRPIVIEDIVDEGQKFVEEMNKQLEELKQQEKSLNTRKIRDVNFKSLAR